MHMRWPLGTAHDRWTHDLLALLRSQQRCREQLGAQNSKCHSLQRPNRRKWWEHRLCLSIHLCTQLQLTSSSPFCQMGTEDHTGKCSSQVCSCKLCNCSTAWNLILRKFLMATWKRRLLRHSTTWAVKSVRKKTMELNHQENLKHKENPFLQENPKRTLRKTTKSPRKAPCSPRKPAKKHEKKHAQSFTPRKNESHSVKKIQATEADTSCMRKSTNPRQMDNRKPRGSAAFDPKLHRWCHTV